MSVDNLTSIEIEVIREKCHYLSVKELADLLGKNVYDILDYYNHSKRVVDKPTFSNNTRPPAVYG
jgi:hypothetical protein